VGAQTEENRSTKDVERFLALLRFENRFTLDDLGVKIDIDTIKPGDYRLESSPFENKIFSFQSNNGMAQIYFGHYL